jgi:mRNA interferase HicA
MKKKDVENRLKDLGWWFDEHGGKHDSWTNGKIKESLPRHKEINEMLAKKIIKKAENNPPERDER